MIHRGPPKAEAAIKGIRSRNGIGWCLDFAMTETVDVKHVLASFECSKGKNRHENTKEQQQPACSRL